MNPLLAIAFDDYLEDSSSLMQELVHKYVWLRNSSLSEKDDVVAVSDTEMPNFLSQILMKFEKILDVHFEEALMLTSLLSTLSHIPLESLHCLLFSPSPLPLPSPSSSSFSADFTLQSLLIILEKLIEQIRQRAVSTPNLSTLFSTARREMDDTNDNVSLESREETPDWIKVREYESDGFCVWRNL